uniref:Uncharacterized protein n=1 Tax=Panagrolaimus davidi TaxID=227884 RepID=A0A914PVP3_9BILA
MVASETVVKTEHLSIELSTNVKDGLLNAVKNIKPGIKKTETLTKKDIFGIKNLNISQITTNDLKKGDISRAYAAEYSHDLNEDFSLKISGRYSSGKVTVPLIINSGFYVVVSVPIYGVQCTVKYNIITEDIIVIFRAPLPDGNDDDKKV